MALQLYTSNKLEILSEKLAETVTIPLANPLAPEHIVVQSRGMERWISLELARRQGICANVEFSFPNAIIYRLARLLFPELPETSPYEPAVLKWAIMKLLPDCTKMSGFENIHAYIKDGSQLKQFQIAERIADTFDQYLVFRPEMIAGWQQKKFSYPHSIEEGWQASLWRLIVDAVHCAHRAQLMQDFYTTLKQDASCHKKLPERISVFGISVLPPFHINFFAELARVIQLNLFILNPCRQYWGAIVTEREATRIIKKHPSEQGGQDLHLEQGNSLLAALGTYGREFFNVLLDFDCELHEYFADLPADTILSCIQSDILNLNNRGTHTEKTTIDKHDTSLQIHVCHSPMREIEGLYDTLLSLFNEDPNVRPHDILVMTPDIETYTPFIHAVFSAPEQDELRIPFSIADQGMLKQSTLCDTFLAICNLCKSRFGVSQVMPILETSAVQRRFTISATDIELLRSWIAETRIRWGVDEQSREQSGVPGFRQNTWGAGLERLLLGYALPGNDKHLFKDILPYDDVEGESARVLGNLIEFTDRLFALRHVLSTAKPLKQWSEALSDVLEQFFEPDSSDEHVIRFMHQTFAELAMQQELTGFDEPVAPEVVTELLKRSFVTKSGTAGFITGSVTFCAMLPMRSIPFKVVCLIGMNDGTFPRQSHPPGFNLIPHYPQPCDRSLKKEDRYVFLEALLSARNKMYISYTGQSIQDNTTIPPSVVVSELLDYLQQAFDCPGQDIAGHITTRHHLQAFNPDYFQQHEKFYSFSEENCRCAQKFHAPRSQPLPFFQEALPEPEDEYRTVDINDLCRFFAHPARYLVQKRLGIFLDYQGLLFEDRENFTVAGLEKYELEQNMLKKMLAGSAPDMVYNLANAQGILPHGTCGELVYTRSCNTITDFIQTVSDVTGQKQPGRCPVELVLDRFTLTGSIDSIYQSQHISFRYAVLRPQDFLSLWLKHVVLNYLQSDCESVLIGLEGKNRDPGVWHYQAIQDCADILTNLLHLYWQGIKEPIAFFPKASFVFAEAVADKGKAETAALERARAAFQGSERAAGDLHDPYIKLCFSNTEPLDKQFSCNARMVYEPLLKHRHHLQ